MSNTVSGPIGKLGTIPTLTIGGEVFTDLTNLIILFTNTGNAAPMGTFRKNNTAGYQVTAGKTLTIKAMRWIIQDVNTNVQGARLAQSDNDVGLTSATALTNPIYYYGTTTNDSGILTLTDPNFVSMREMGGLSFDVQATKYLSISAGSNLIIKYFAYGYEA